MEVKVGDRREVTSEHTHRRKQLNSHKQTKNFWCRNFPKQVNSCARMLSNGGSEANWLTDRRTDKQNSCIEWGGRVGEVAVMMRTAWGEVIRTVQDWSYAIWKKNGAKQDHRKPIFSLSHVRKTRKLKQEKNGKDRKGGKQQKGWPTTRTTTQLPSNSPTNRFSHYRN